MLSLIEKQMLMKLVEDNGMSSVIWALANISSENADNFSDLSLKDKSKQAVLESDLLRKLHMDLTKL